MIRYIPLIIVLLIGCASQPVTTKTEAVDYSQYDDIVMQDLKNKQKEILILREIKIAQDNNDTEAYEFFMQEYFDVPRLKLTADQKQHPQYREWLTDEQIKSAAYMSVEFDYVK
jgi:hypothetical protein